MTRKAHRAEHTIFPDRFLNVLRRADHQQEEGNDQSDDSDNGHKHLEDDLEGFQTSLNNASLHDNHCTVSQNITNAIDDLSLLALRNIRVQPDEKFRFRDVVSEVIIRYSRHECRFIIWVECEHLLHVLLKGLYRDCNSWTSRIDLDQQIAQVVRELLAWHLID